jgi:hypothetical protein
MSEEFVPNEAITAEVMQQYEVIRQSGVTNMFDANAVAFYAYQQDFFALASVASDRKLYRDLLFNYADYQALYALAEQ